MQTRRGALLALVIVLLVAPRSAGIANGGDHRLVAGDRISTAVSGQPERSGDVIVVSGNVTIPEVNAVPAAHVREGHRELGHRHLADGIVPRLPVSASLRERRSVYVFGDVRVPGAYPFHLGRTVQAAIALAGGLICSEMTLSSARSEFLLADDRARKLIQQEQALLARVARLEAQLAGKKNFSPAPVDEKRAAAVEISAIGAEADHLVLQSVFLRSETAHFEEQIEALNQHADAAESQPGLAKEQVDHYDSLVKKGLSSTSFELPLGPTGAAKEAFVWRSMADISRLQMAASELDVSITEAESSYRRQVANELHDLRERLADLDVLLPIAREVREARLLQADGILREEDRRAITVRRLQNGKVLELGATEATALEPGDTVEVSWSIPQLWSAMARPTTSAAKFGGYAPATRELMADRNGRPR